MSTRISTTTLRRRRGRNAKLGVNKELGIETEEGFRTSIKRGSFRRLRADVEVAETRDMRAERRRANVRFVVIVAALLALAAVLYFSSGEFLAL